jgi:hypothetical protein
MTSVPLLRAPALLVLLLAATSQAATFTVTTTADSGAGSLRQAITDANANSGADTIDFAIPAGECSAAGVCTITLSSLLPEITEAVTIDGTTQPQSGTAPANVCATGTAPSYLRVEVIAASAASLDSAFVISSPGPSTIRGLSLGGGSPIDLRSAAAHRVQCDHIGVDGPGTGTLDLGYAGVVVDYNGAGVIIGTDGDGVEDEAEGNVFAGAYSYGIYVNGNPDNRIAGNTFGLAADGITPLPCSTGVQIRQYSSGNLVGSNEDGVSDDLEGNLFSGCIEDVLLPSDTAGSDNQIVRNVFVGSGSGSDFGIDLEGGGGTLVRNNILRGTGTAIQVANDASLAPGSQGNCLEGNTTGLLDTGSAAIVFDRNWWGAADGPSGDAPGSGDPLSVTGSGGVDYQPFMTAGCTFVPEPPSALAALASASVLVAMGIMRRQARRSPRA